MRRSLNDSDREKWVANVEPLYRAQQASRMSVCARVHAHRGEIDDYTNAVLDQKPAR